MDAEGLYFTSLLRGRQIGALRGVNREHLVEQFRPLYDYVVEFVQKQSGLPRWETVDARFPNALPPNAPEDVEFYSQAIRENAMRLSLEDGINESVVPHLQEQRAENALAGARQVVTDVSEQFRQEWEGTCLSDISGGVEQRMADYRLRKAAQGAVGIPTPFRTLTMVTGGLQTCDAVAILSRPNLGKTWAMVLWAVFLWQLGYRVLFASMETPPAGRKPKSKKHRVIGKMCMRCYDVHVTEEEDCPAADIPRQRLSVRFDALGSRLSAWRLYKGWLTPQEERKLERYYAAVETRNNGKWGHLKIVAAPYISTLADLEMEIHQYNPDVVFWDSAYLGAKAVRGSKENKWAHLARGFKLMLERVGIPGVVSWHFNREVSETAQSGPMNCGALTDEIPRVFDTIIGLFRPPEIEEANEAIWRGLKTRDGLRMGKLRTNFEVKDHIDFSEIPDGGNE